MMPAHFKLGMARIEGALQGKFEPAFMDYLWGEVKHAESHQWEAAVQQMCRSLKKPNQLVAQEFITLVSEAGNRERQQRTRAEEMRERERVAAGPPEEPIAMWRRMHETLKAAGAPENALAFCARMIDRLETKVQPKATA